MGDSGEGLVDAEARIQERMEELQEARRRAKNPVRVNPDQFRKLESLKLARKEMSRQIESTGHAARKNQLASAIQDLDRQISQIENNV
jgi:hypothetical protein